MTGPGNPDPGGDSAAEDEVARLRARVDQLKADLEGARADTPAGPTAAPPGRRGRWRPAVAGVLIVVAALLAPFAVVAAWARDEVGDTDRYVQTVAPLASDPAVQSAVIDRITTEILNYVDVKAVVQDAIDALASRGLPPRASANLSALAVPIAQGVRGFIEAQVTRVVESSAFEQAWIAANRQAHTQLVAVLTGEGATSVKVEGDAVSVNLATVINTVKQQLVDAGFALAARIPTVDAEFTVFESADIQKAQTGFRLLKGAAVLLPVLALILLIGAVYVGRSRRYTLMAAALAIALSMVVLGLALNLFRTIYLDAVPASHVPQDAAAAIYDTLVGFIRLNLRAVIVFMLAIAIGAWVTGASAAAVAVRRGLTGGIATLRGQTDRAGLDTGRFGVALYTYRTPLRAVTVGVAVLIYVLAAHPTGAWTLGVLAVTVVVLLLIEFLGHPPEAAEGPGSASTGRPAGTPGPG